MSIEHSIKKPSGKTGEGNENQISQFVLSKLYPIDFLVYSFIRKHFSNKQMFLLRHCTGLTFLKNKLNRLVLCKKLIVTL